MQKALSDGRFFVKRRKMSERTETIVACAVLMDEEGRSLLSSRPQGKVYAGWWEFPGGKLEAMETVEEAAKREIKEELGIDMHDCAPWVTIVFDYPHAKVRLHFVRSWNWSGTPKALEKQDSFGFFAPESWPSPVLEASQPIQQWLNMPKYWLKLKSEAIDLEVLKQRKPEGVILCGQHAKDIDQWKETLKTLGVKEVWVDALAHESSQQKADGVFVDDDQDGQKVSNKRFALKADPSCWSEIAASGALFAWVDPTVRVASSAWLRLMSDNPVPLYLTNVKITNDKLLRPHGANGWIETI